jgi:predicted transcriptional regulator
MPKKVGVRFITIECDPELMQRIDALAAAEHRSRRMFVLHHLERLVAQGPQELPEERSVA